MVKSELNGSWQFLTNCWVHTHTAYIRHVFWAENIEQSRAGRSSRNSVWWQTAQFKLVYECPLGLRDLLWIIMHYTVLDDVAFIAGNPRTTIWTRFLLDIMGVEYIPNFLCGWFGADVNNFIWTIKLDGGKDRYPQWRNRENWATLCGQKGFWFTLLTFRNY